MPPRSAPPDRDWFDANQRATTTHPDQQSDGWPTRRDRAGEQGHGTGGTFFDEWHAAVATHPGDPYWGDDHPDTAYAPHPDADRGTGRDGYDHHSTGHHPKVRYDTDHRSTDGYPADRYAADQHPSGAYPTDRYAADQHPSGAYPTDRYAADQHSTDGYPPGRYPGGDHPTQRYAADRYQADDRYPAREQPVGGYGTSGSPADDEVADLPPPEPRGSGYATRKLLAGTLFWVALVASVAIWWINTPAGAITDQTAIYLAAGRITGLVSGFILLVEILTMTRVPWIESWFGSHGLMNWHRSLGGALVVLTIAHAGLLIVAYARAAKKPVDDATWSMVTTMQDMVATAVGTGILVVAGLLSARFIRRRMPYEFWHGIHMTLYLVIFLAYGHQLSLGAAVITDGYARWYWIGLHVFVGACFCWGRVIRPTWFNARHRFRVSQVVDEGHDWVSIYISGNRMETLSVDAGQYFRWRFLASGCWWQSHPFSISAAPNGEWLRVSVKAIGNHTRDLQDIEVGTRVLLSEATGSFTAARRVTEKALLIAFGSGVAPAVSLLEDLPEDTMMVYRVRDEDDVVLRDELEHLAAQRNAKVYFVLGRRTDPWPKRLLTAAGLQQLVPDVAERDAYLCGPGPLIRATVGALRSAGVPRRQIHLDPYEF